MRRRTIREPKILQTIRDALDCWEPVEDRKVAYEVVMNYYLKGEEPDDESSNQIVKVMFPLAKDLLDKFGERSTQNRIIRSSGKYRRFRKAVLERDGYKCLNCGETEGRLHVHHIIPFSKCPEERFNPNNGATLCEKCHREIHRNEK